MELHLKIVGAISILLACIHLVFPRYFKWKIELADISLINKQLMYVHTFFIGLVVLLIGIFCIYCAADIVHTKLGQQLSFGLFVFWATRLVFQFFVYSPQLWKGKKFESTVHILFSFLWIYFTVVFFLVYTKGNLN
jgi:hypothetical protein